MFFIDTKTLEFVLKNASNGFRIYYDNK